MIISLKLEPELFCIKDMILLDELENALLPRSDLVSAPVSALGKEGILLPDL